MVDNVAAVSLKLPTFWTERAAVWFLQAEAQFATRHITQDETKYYYVVAALDQDTATRVLDLLQAPPPADKYATLKGRLLSCFTLTESQRAATLLNLPGLGDDKPSQLMDKMLALLGNHPPCFLFREIYMRHMPQEIRSHLVHANIVDVRELAQAADALWISSNCCNVNAIGRPDKHSISYTARNRTANSTAARSGTLPRTRSNVETSNSDEVCYYHRRFGEAANQCRPPCNFATSENSRAGRQ